MDEDVKGLVGWLEDDTDMKEIDATLEWLNDSEMLTDKGKKFVHKFWHWCWHERKGK